MNLLEVVLASALFAGSACGSARICALATASVAQDEHDQQLLERSDAALAVVEATLRQQPRPPLPLANCPLETQRLAAVVGLLPVPAGLSRRLGQSEAGTQLLVTVLAAGLGEPRTRLYSPAALGLCRREVTRATA
jgi:hypothetical protein